MLSTIFHNNLFILIIYMVWVLPWKAYALWTSARRADKKWFIALMLINTFGLLEIFYLFYYAKKTPKDILRLFKVKL